MATLTITGTAADDTIVITASGTDSGSYSINGGPAVAFSASPRSWSPARTVTTP